MSRIEYEVNGRKVPANRFADAFEEAALQHMRKQLEHNLQQRTAHLRCPTHNQAAKLIIKFDSNDYSVQVEGCCQEFVNSVMNTMK